MYRLVSFFVGIRLYVQVFHIQRVVLANFLGGNNNFTPGFQTPAKAYGADLILELPGTIRK